MNYQRTFPVVDGNLCDKHIKMSGVEVETPDMYKVFWLFLRNQIRRVRVLYESPKKQHYKTYPTDGEYYACDGDILHDVITDREATFNALDKILNIKDFNIDQLK